MSSSGSSYSLPTGPRQLHRVAFEGEDTAHWALFLPDRDGGARGILVHVGANKGKSGRKENHTLRSSPFLITSSTAQSVFPIAHAAVTESQLTRAAEEVFQRKGYRLLTNNCQHFCIDVVTELNRVWPHSVPPEAVIDVASRGTTITNLTRWVRRDRLNDPRAQQAEEHDGSRERISIS
jgi:hypothetical protein